jgi:hypothetical protein
VSIAQE